MDKAALFFAFSPGALYELQRSESHKHADIFDPEPSEISFGIQVDLASNGFSIDPKRIDVEKHSLMNEVDVADLCHEYQRQASPSSQSPCCLGSVSSNRSQSGLTESVENKLPHW